MIIQCSFFKRHKTQDISEIPEPQQELQLRQRALNIFSRIEGLDDIKEMMLRALESPEKSSYTADRTSGLYKIIIYIRDREGHAF